MKKSIKIMAISIIATVLCIFNSLTLSCKAESVPRYEYKFVLIEENGYLNVYKTDNLIVPYYSIKFNIKVLPEQDQEELKNGILILDTNELKKAIENYTG